MNEPIEPLLRSLNLHNVNSNSDQPVVSWKDIFAAKPTVAQYCTNFVNLVSTQYLKDICKEMLHYKMQIQGFHSEGQIIAKVHDKKAVNAFIGAIVFDSNFHQRISYKLRFRYYHRNLLPDHFSNSLAYDWETGFSLPSKLDPIDLKYQNLTDGGLPAYWREAFLSVQKAVDTVLIEKLLPAENKSLAEKLQLFLKRFPYPEHQTNSFYTSTAAFLLPLVLMFSFMLSILYVSRSIALTEEKRIKEYLFLSGLHPLAFYGAYFVLNGLKLVPTVLILSGVFYVIFANSNFFLLLSFVLLYAVNALCFAFLISSTIKKGTIATVGSAILWFALYLPTFYLQKNESKFSENVRFYSCFLLNTGTSYGFRLLSSMESQGKGIVWNNIGEKMAGLSFAFIICALLTNCLVFLILSLILQCPLKSWVQMGSCLNLKNLEISSCSHASFTKSYQQKSDPSYPNLDKNKNKKVGNDTEVFKIKVRNLSVVLSPDSAMTVAVKDVSFDAYDKMITVLLGRNGSGKSTVMNVITGLQKAAEGTVNIGNFDAHRDKKVVQRRIGYCPQYNPLFDQLSINEHLEFFTDLKSNGNISFLYHGSLLLRMNIWDKRYCQAQHLSGGMKRKLSLAIALCAQPEVTLLDEPTSGLDPAIRQEVQGLLLREKHDRLVLLTTHYLEEADVLGDQVIIMNQGKVLDKGSSRMLKRKFGEYLTISITFDEENAVEYAKEVHSLLKTHTGGCSFTHELDGRFLSIKVHTDQLTWEM